MGLNKKKEEERKPLISRIFPFPHLTTIIKAIFRVLTHYHCTRNWDNVHIQLLLVNEILPCHTAGDDRGRVPFAIVAD